MRASEGKSKKVSSSSVFNRTKLRCKKVKVIDIEPLLTVLDNDINDFKLKDNGLGVYMLDGFKRGILACSEVKAMIKMSGFEGCPFCENEKNLVHNLGYQYCPKCGKPLTYDAQENINKKITLYPKNPYDKT